MPRTGGYRYNMPHKEYWEQRARETLNESFSTMKDVDDYLYKVYKDGLEHFTKLYFELIKPYMLDNGELDVDAIQKELIYNKKFQRKKVELEKEITLFIKKVNPDAAERILNGLKKVYKNTVIKTYKDFNYSTGMRLLNSYAIERAVKTPFTSDGREFSDRIWTNHERMNVKLRKELADSIAQGKSIQKTSREFKNIMNNTYYNSSRLIRTETIATYAKGSIDSYKDVGIKEVEILENSSGTCDICAKMNGTKVNINEAQVGINIPPYHPFVEGLLFPSLIYKRMKNNSPEIIRIGLES